MYRNWEDDHLVDSPHDHSPEKSETDKSERLRNLACTMSNLKNRIKLLKLGLGKTINWWERFEKEDIKFFQEDSNNCPDAS